MHSVCFSDAQSWDIRQKQNLLWVIINPNTTLGFLFCDFAHIKERSKKNILKLVILVNQINN